MRIYAHLLTQASGGALFEGDWHYDMATDSFIGITGINTDMLDDLETEALGLANTGERQIFWHKVMRMVEYSVGTEPADMMRLKN